MTAVSKLRAVHHLSRPHTAVARTTLAFFAALALTFTWGAAPAAAVPAPNETVISLDPLVATALNVAKVKVTPKGAAKGGSAGIYYPVVNSRGVTDAFVGTTKHQGGFEIKLGTLRVGFRNFEIKTKKGSPVTGVLDAYPVINGINMPFSVPFSTVKVKSVQKKSGYLIAKYDLAIDPRVAKLINDTLKIKLVTPGDPWGSAETRITR